MSEPVEKRASPPSSVGEDANKGQSRPLDFAERRRQALHEIDTAKFSWFHARVALVAGAGFFTDA